MKDTGNGIAVRLIHCKYSQRDGPGARVKDVVEVSSQAVKNARWFWGFDRLVKRMKKRHMARQAQGAGRFFTGNLGLLQKFIRLYEISGMVKSP